MQLLRWLRREGVLPDKEPPLPEDVDRPLSALERLQWILREYQLEEEEVLARLATRYGFSLLPAALHQLWPLALAEQESLYQQHVLLLEGTLGEPWLALTLVADWHRLAHWQFRHPGLQLGLVSQARLALLFRERQGETLNPVDVEVSQQWQELLREALRRGASDIHLEPDTTLEQLQGRLRVEGGLQSLPNLSLPLSTQLVPHLKLRAGLDIAVRRRPQDGYLQQRTPDGRLLDLRLSCLPTEQGEKLVLRLLDPTLIRWDLPQLGFYEEDRAVLQAAMQRQHGLLLVVGPTGSGKTTTLYALLSLLDAERQNIVTIEDPVEYHLPHLNQVSVQPAQGLGFAETLRAALRQDPDVILVGEIRDDETAQIAVKAALTGHLVLSTLHTNNTLSSLQRMENLGVDPSLLADTLLLVLSQRLVKARSGGRLPVYELLRVDEQLQERLRRRLPASELFAPYPGLYFRPLDQVAEQLIADGRVEAEELVSFLPWS